MATVVLANIRNGLGAAVIVNGDTIYHEDDDKGYSQNFTAAEVAKRTAKALGVKLKRVTLGVKEIGDDEWNFDELEAAANKKTGVQGAEDRKAIRAAKLMTLRDKEAEFKAAGGRGVELADEIDTLRAELGK